ncbi:f-box domain-containing [Pyrenophora seminiperda CCB06]|uniref:F-box domain-containing n=1 Tax=Pyrenophora seminiperda CCB06 TaxID=1302712 RepID=A0A3M7MEZ3_9PLEO|nr:f-box domain-containing [Pyrenophora seminiperda CCB06]
MYRKAAPRRMLLGAALDEATEATENNTAGQAISLFAGPSNTAPPEAATTTPHANPVNTQTPFAPRRNERLAATIDSALSSSSQSLPPTGYRGRSNTSHRVRGSRSRSWVPPSARQGNSTLGQEQGEMAAEGAYEQDLALAMELGMLDDNFDDPFEEQGNDNEELARLWDSMHAVPDGGESSRQPRPLQTGNALNNSERERQPHRNNTRTSRAQFDHLATTRSFHVSRRSLNAAPKRSYDRSESTDEQDIGQALHDDGAVAVMLYDSATPNPDANDIWPECRSATKLPARYYLIDEPKPPPSVTSRWRPNKKNRKKKVAAKKVDEPRQLLQDTSGRPVWNLPVELIELIAQHLNRDDIKALRLVSRELNHNVSQVIFQTVVVPFNTEIYGMLAQDANPDLKGKSRARFGNPGYYWKNANGDEVYNGHGLDVFHGFGRHIRKFGMSFQVGEDSLSMPPVKSLTEKKTSFWGTYDWPFDEYRRFDAVAGLETAADKTPRMTVAFSELTNVKELALSIDSGLGWLSGPDKSIRARILQKPPSVFGTSKPISDRRAQAQQELWNYIEAAHQRAGSDVRIAMLYRMNTQGAFSEMKHGSVLADVQPEIPYLDPQLIQGAPPQVTPDMPIPTSFDDPYILEGFVSPPSPLGTGVLFTSPLSSSDAGQLMSPIIPSSLTKSQKEWLMETEWAQRAFMSSYMLSVIDNPTTFQPVHTLNISGLSDRYLPMLNRADFWNSLPNLRNVTLMVIPSWRTVYKDEAGFVDAPKINPTDGINLVFDLLRDYVACRPNVRNLTAGWVTGGEHAEGLYARNKLLFPAPVMDLRVRAANSVTFQPTALVESDKTRLRASLLHFPHLEQLTLKNCWMTPPALLQFVQIHDSHSLRKLVLDSVSLTAILRPNPDPNQVVHVVHPGFAFHNGPLPPPGVLWGAVGGQHAQPAQLMPNQHQFLLTTINTLQAQLQQLHGNALGFQQNQVTVLQNILQLQLHNLQLAAQGPVLANPPAAAVPGHPPQPLVQHQLMQHFQAAVSHHQPAAPHAANVINHVGVVAAQVQQLQQQIGAGHQPLVAVPANVNYVRPQATLRAKPREGSWMSIIDQISPGTNLSDFGNRHSKADSDRVTSLHTIEFVSCGYAKLPHTSFDQSTIDIGNGLAATLRAVPTFHRRMAALAPAMLSSKWNYLGEIVQDVAACELAALQAGWHLRTGWEDKEAARAVEFDGLLAGGTGRFTGILRQFDRLDELLSR